MRPSGTNWLLFGIFVAFLFAFVVPESADAQTQNFDGTFPPTGFSAPVGTGTADEGAVQWYRSDDALVTDNGNTGLEPGKGASGHSAVFNTYDIQSDGVADLVMENVDLSGYSNAELRFYLKNTSGSDVVRVYARNASDSYVQYGSSSYGAYSDWTEIVVNLTALSGGSNTTVDIRFEGTSDWGVTNIGLDDISVAEGPPPLSGTYSVGPSSDDYTSLTSAFAAITSSGLSGAVILDLQSDYVGSVETFPIVASTNATVTNTITVRPATGATARVIETTGFGDVAFSLDGARYVTIDGRPGGTGSTSELAIKSTGGFGGALEMKNDASNNTVKFCTLYTPAGIATVFIGTSVSTGNSNNLISDCLIGGDNIDVSTYGILIGGTAVSNSTNTILRCNIADCLAGLGLDSQVDATLVDQCNFYSTSPFTGTGVFGIVVGEALTSTIQRCKFYNLSCSDAALVNIQGIVIGGGSGAGSSTTIRNNFFSFDAAGTTDPADVTAILYASAGASDVCEIYFNTIYIGGSGITSGSSRGIHKSAAASSFIQENNIIVNARSNAAGTGTHYAVAIDNTTGVGTVNYNDYFTTGTGGVLGSWSSVDKSTLTDWKTASSKDANSVSKAITFVGAGTNDLHIAGGSVGDVELIGTPIGGITNDLDGDTRHATYPYMGADENVGSPLPVQISMFTAAAMNLGAELRWTTATETNSYGFEIERRQVGQEKSNAAWAKIGFVQGGGANSSPREYSFVDEDISFGRYAYRLKQVDLNGQFAYVGSVEVEVGLAPKELTLSRNYPNPFNPATSIQFTLPEDGRATLKVYDAVGREVATLFDGEAQAGRYYRVNFDAARLSSGIYFSRLEFGGKQQVKSMLLVK